MQSTRIKSQCFLEKEISEIIFKDNESTCHFDYKILGNYKYNLIVYTINPNKDNELFLMFKTFIFDSKLECLEQTLEYLKSIEKNKNNDKNVEKYLLTYEVVWSKNGTTKNYTSWVNGNDLIEICNKFFEGKNPKDYIIRQIKLMPES